jgi:hypothetical protein
MRVKLDKDRPAEDEGTIWVFPGQVMGGQWDGLSVRVAVDHRPARFLAEQLANPEAEVLVEAESWQVLL